MVYEDTTTVAYLEGENIPLNKIKIKGGNGK